jgi:hypothetical protein
MKDTDTTDTIDNVSVTTDPMPIATFLVQLGKVLLSKTHHTEWLDADTIATLSQDHQIQLNGTIPTPGELEPLLMEYFSKRDEVFEEGVSAVGYNRRVGWDLVFMVRFDRFRVGCQTHFLGMLDMDDDARVPTFHD